MKNVYALVWECGGPEIHTVVINTICYSNKEKAEQEIEKRNKERKELEKKDTDMPKGEWKLQILGLVD